MSPYIATLILVWGLLDLSSVVPITASHRHLHHRHRWSDYGGLEESVPRQLSLHRLAVESNRRWRSQDPWTEDDETEHSSGRPKRHFSDIEETMNSSLWDRDVEKAQNDSLCAYTVRPMDSIYDSTGAEIFKGLKQITCRVPGATCHSGGSHCCIQTFISVTKTYFSNGKKYHRPKRINTGCICAHRRIKDATPDLN